MKNLFKVLIITTCVITGFFLTNCMKPLDYTEFMEIADGLKDKDKKQTIAASDFTIEGTGVFEYTEGQDYPVSITPKEGKSTGDITIYYGDSTTPPSEVGVYIITFSVESAPGFNAAQDMYAGMLSITSSSYLTPVVSDFDFTGLETHVENQNYTVTITPKPGKTDGAITIYYNGSPTAPSQAGVYLVAFEVKATPIYNGAGLYAGMLTITSPALATPTIGNFAIAGLGSFPYDGTQREVTVTRGGSSAGITVYYNSSTTAPSAAGSYLVNFEAAATAGFNAVGLSAGMLTITSQVPVSGDYTISGDGIQSHDGSQKIVTVEKDGSSAGITVFYQMTSPSYGVKTETAPTDIGVYAVTFDTAATANSGAASNLNAGTLFITHTPVEADFNFSGLTQTYYSDVRDVTITPIAGKSSGIITNIYYDGSTVKPTAVGSYPVTFDVAPEGQIFNAASGLSAGTLVINPHTPTADDYVYTWAGKSFICGVEPVRWDVKPGASLAAVTVYYQLKTAPLGSETTAIPDTSGTYNVIFDIASEPNFNAAKLNMGTYTLVRADNLLTGAQPYTLTEKHGTPEDIRRILDYHKSINFNINYSKSGYTGFPYYFDFYGRDNLIDVKLPDSFAATSNSMFNNCKNLKSVYLGNNFQAILNAAFMYCVSLESITIPDSIVYLDSYIFYHCEGLKSIIIPDGCLVTINSYAFWHCYSLKDVTIGNKVQGIGNNAFEHCESLESITIPDSVEFIHSKAFLYCDSLISVTFDGTVPSIAPDAFNGDLAAKYTGQGTYIVTVPGDENTTEWTKVP